MFAATILELKRKGPRPKCRGPEAKRSRLGITVRVSCREGEKGIVSLTLMRLLTLAHQHRQPRQPIRRGNGYKMRSALLGDVARVRRKRQKTKRKCAGQCHASGQRKDQGEN